MSLFRVVRLTKAGVMRVLNGHEGMTFPIASGEVEDADNSVLHVRDYRFPSDPLPYEVWALLPGDYKVVT